MKRRLPVLVAALSLATMAAPARPAPAVVPSPVALLRAAASWSPVTLDLGSEGVVTVRLWPSGVVNDATRTTTTDGSGRLRDVPREGFTTLAGEVSDDPDGMVRLTVAGRSVSGLILAHGRWITFEPDATGATVIGHPTRSSGAPAGTPLTAPPPAPAPLPPVTVSIIPTAGAANCVVFACSKLTAKAVLDGDVFFRALNPKTCQTRQAAVFNAVDGIYSRPATRIHFVVSQINCRTQADLGSKGTDPVRYLDTLRQSWTGVAADRSFLHLSSGFDFTGSTVGLSYIPGVCGRLEPSTAGPVVFTQSCSSGYGLHQAVGAPKSNYNGSFFMQTKLEAHEIGHSFNAEHDPSSMCPLKSPRRGPIMCAVLQEQGKNIFSSASAQAIRSWAEQTIGSITGT